MKRETLIPIEQALIPFHGGEIFAVRLLNGIIGVTLVSLCNLLKIAKWPQLRRIREDEVLSKHLLLVIVDTPGGPQATEVLTAQAIPTWLTGLQPSMVAPEKRPLILALKEEAVEVLYRHFFHIDAEPAPPPQPEQPHAPPRSPRALIQQGFQLIDEAAQMLETEQQAVKDHMATLDRRQEAIEETVRAMGERQEVLRERQRAMGAHLVETRERQRGIEETQQAMSQWQEVAEERWEALGDYLVETRERVAALEQQPAASAGRADEGPLADGPLLSPQQLAQLFALAREARRERGTPISEQLTALAEALGVPDVSDLPESAWSDVLAWFWERRQRG